MLTGAQRLDQVRVKTRIIDRRNLRDFLEGKLPYCPCSVIDDMIAKEFERIAPQEK